MNCEELLRMLDEEGRVTSRAAEEHLTICPGCARARDRWQAVQRELAALGEEEGPGFLHARIMAHVRSVQGGRAPRLLFGWRPAILGSLMVLGLVVVAGGLRLWRSPAGGPPASEPLATLAERSSDKADALSSRSGSTPAKAAPISSSEDAPPAAVRAPLPQTAPPAPQRKRVGSSESALLAAFPVAEPALPAALEPEADEEASGAVRGVGASAAAKQETPIEVSPASLADSQVAVERELSVADAAYPQVLEERALAETRGRPELASSAGKKLQRAAVRAAPAMSTVSQAGSVECSVTSPQGEPVARLSVPVIEAPPTAARWLLRVADDGEVTVTEAEGDAPPAAADQLSKRLGELTLSPGTYVLLRVPPGS